MQVVRIIEGYTRDLGLPAEVWQAAKDGKVELWNAARPFPAHESFTGEFVCGIFYGVIHPDLEDADEIRERAIELDARKFIFISKEEVEQWGRDICTRLGLKYSEHTYVQIVHSYLEHCKRLDKGGE